MRSIVKILKKVKRQPRRAAAGVGRGASPWMVMGALVASTALGAKAAPADARELRRPRITHSAAAAPIVALAKAGDQQAPVVRFDIPAGPLDAAIRAFEAATNLKLDVQVPLDTISMVQTAGLSGAFTPAEGLRRLLAGSGMAARETASGMYVVEIRVAEESVEVLGRMPSVSLPKFTEPLREIPQTINVIPAEVMRQQGATSLRDVLRNVTGITFQAGEGGGGLPGDKLTLRGFSADNDIFVDGLRDVGAYSRDAFNLEQVEVIKGASSAIGGRGGAGGAINLSTKTANQTATRTATFGFGNASYQRGTLDVNQPLGEAAALRLNAMWTDAGYPGRDVVENQSWAIAPSFALGLGRPTRLVVNYQHMDQDNVPDYGLSWGSHTDPATGVVYPTGALDATPEVDQSNFYGLRDYDYEDIRNDVGTVRFEHDFAPALTLRNITRIGSTERDSAITAPRPPNRQLQQRYMENTARANATSLSGRFATGRIRHSAVTGLEFIRETSYTYNQAQTTNQPQTTLQNPNPDDRPFGPMPVNLGNTHNDATTMTVGAYLFDTVDLHDRLQVTGGLRWDRSNVDFSSLTRSTGATTNLERTDRMVSWRGGVVYRPRHNGSVYVGYSTSVNPTADAGNTGAALSDAPNSANNINLEPEKTNNLEVGTKWDVAGERLSLNAALFRTEKTNARTRNANDEPFVLDGTQRVVGVEMGVSGAITRAWTMLATATFMDSDITATANPDEQGQDFARVPKTSASLWTTYAWPVGLTVGGGLTYQDSVYRNTTNTASVPSYRLLNATASYLVNHMLTLRLNADNLADEKYVDRVGGGHYIPGLRRAVRLSADVRF